MALTKYARADLVREALANLGIIYQDDASGTKTRNDLILNALQGLGILASGQTASAEDVAAVNQNVDTVAALLRARVVVPTLNVDAIPQAWFESLGDILGNACKDKFGVTGQVSTDLERLAMLGERNLKNMTRATLIDRNIDAILAELAARDVVFVSDDSDIPQEWFGPLATIVADRVKGKFELEADVIARAQAGGIEGLATLRELTRGRPSYLPARATYF